MIESEIFLKYPVGGMLNRPFFHVQPFGRNFTPIALNTLDLFKFKAINMHLANLKNGNIIEDDSLLYKPSFKAVSLDAFLEINEDPYKYWHVMQGICVPEFSENVEGKIYLARINPEKENCVEIIGKRNEVIFSQPLSKVVPYGGIISIPTSYPTELRQKLLEERNNIVRRQENSRQDNPINAIMYISDFIEGKEEYEHVYLLTGFYK